MTRQIALEQLVYLMVRARDRRAELMDKYDDLREHLHEQCLIEQAISTVELTEVTALAAIAAYSEDVITGVKVELGEPQ